jgi:predicted RNA-binding Zn-ribbon protein involved in translation (DUF1610 family)
VETIVKATCPTCGDVELTPADLELRICSAAAASTYHFTCTACEKVIVKSASDHRIVTLLTSVGVPTVVWELPAELSETHEGPPLTLDDLIDLRLALESPNWARLLGLASA